MLSVNTVIRNTLSILFMILFTTKGQPCDFQIFRHDDLGSVAASAGYSLVPASDLGSGTTYNQLTSFLSSNNNQIKALGSWNTGYDCLYIGSDCTIATSNDSACDSVQSWIAGNTYTLCPWSEYLTIEDGLQALTSVTYIEPDTIGIFKKCFGPTSSPIPTITPNQCGFQIYRYNDTEAVAASVGYSLVSVSDIRSGDIHDAFISFMTLNNNEIKALGSWNTGYDCLYIGSDCSIATSNDSLCDSVQSWIAGFTYTLCPWDNYETIEEGLQALDTSASIEPDTIALYVNGLNCEYTTAPTTVSPTAPTTTNPTLFPTTSSPTSPTLSPTTASPTAPTEIPTTTSPTTASPTSTQPTTSEPTEDIKDKAYSKTMCGVFIITILYLLE